MIITGDRVSCANCDTIYNKPPTENVFWIGIPFRIEGIEYCPKCGSNATNILNKEYGSESTAMSTDFTFSGEVLLATRGTVGD